MIPGMAKQNSIITPPGSLLPRPKDEIWAPIDWVDWSKLGFTAEISSYGMVRRKKEGAEREHKYYNVRQDYRGHLEVWVTGNCVAQQLALAPTVLRAFKGKAPRLGLKAKFYDGNPTNCTLPNLFWGTKLDQLIAENEYKERATPTLQHQPGCPKLYGGSCGCNPTHLKEKQNHGKD